MWLWEGPLGRPFGKALWEGSLRRPFGKALWERTEPFWQFDEIDMSECRFVRYVDLCGMIGKYILNVSTGADSKHLKPSGCRDYFSNQVAAEMTSQTKWLPR